MYRRKVLSMMTTWSVKRNEYFKLKTKIEVTRQTIFYLKKCLKNRVFPKFMKLVVNVNNPRSNKACTIAKKNWLKFEIGKHQSNLVLWERRVYELHLRILKECSSDLMFEVWLDEDRYIRCVVEHKKTMKRISQNNKYKRRKLCLSNARKLLEDIPKPEPKLLDDFVINLSSVHLTENEESLLNRGFKFIIPPKELPIDDLCVDVMASVRYKAREVKYDVERTAMRVIQENMQTNNNHTEDKRIDDLHKTVKALREKKLVFARADKSNNVIVMDEEYHDRVVLKTISQGPYVEIRRDPLMWMVKEVNDVLEEHKDIICENPRMELRKWKISNPSVPRLYVMLKTHKDPDEDGDMKARPVASNTNAPTEATAKKLSSIFNSLPPPEGLAVKNGIEFAKMVDGVRVNRVEEMGSYDVTSLYPSIPILPSMDMLRKWLVKVKIGRRLAEAYVRLAKLCMDQNIFQFRGRWYLQMEGTSIGNSLSSFIAELFMCVFEMSMKSHPMFPRIYTRYIDDIFSVQNGRKFDIVKKLFEDKMDSYQKDAVKFTIERQKDEKLPFLNTMVEIVDGVMKIDVYRKPTSTLRMITSDSYHDVRHKMAAYHAMAHFMVSLPLSEEKIAKETEKIVEIGVANGYKPSEIVRIINRHQEKKQLSDISTFYDRKDDKTKQRVGIRFYPKVTKNLKKVYQKYEMDLVHKNEGSLRQALGSLKDEVFDLHKSGVYRIQCSHCGRLYFGMTIRKLFERFNEHVKSAKWSSKTAVGRHIFSSKHEVHISELKLVHQVRQSWKIEYYEAIHIHKNKHFNLLNIDEGNIKSPLLNLFVLERKVDDEIIDLTTKTPDISMSEIFFDCE